MSLKKRVERLEKEIEKLKKTTTDDVVEIANELNEMVNSRSSFRLTDQQLPEQDEQ